MYGWKARIGLILPSPNVVMEPEFNALKPADVSIHATRVTFTESSEGELLKMAAELDQASRLLATAGVNVIAYGCTMGSLFGGAGYDQEIIKRIEQTGCRATTTATAVLRAFKALGVSRIAVGTPYSPGADKMEREFFQSCGLEVVNLKGLDLGIMGIRKAPPETYFELACEVDRPEAEAVFISCTAARTLPIIAALEKRLGKYVLSSNLATFWDVMRMLDVQAPPLRGYGKLLETI
ncbi:MAG: maleate cis-trans isomerase [Chloroflexota bacterium]